MGCCGRGGKTVVNPQGERREITVRGADGSERVVMVAPAQDPAERWTGQLPAPEAADGGTTGQVEGETAPEGETGGNE